MIRKVGSFAPNMPINSPSKNLLSENKGSTKKIRRKYCKGKLESGEKLAFSNDLSFTALSPYKCDTTGK